MDVTILSDCRKQILHLHGKTESDMAEYLKILREWMKKQPHLPSESLQDGLLEICLLKNKFSVEKTKSKIEHYCTLKSLDRYKYFYEDYECIPSKEPIFYLPMPKLTEDFQRILIFKVWDDEKWNHTRGFANILVMREILSRYDYSNGDITVFDLSKCSSIMMRVRINVYADAITLAVKAHSSRVKEIHIVTKSGARFINMVKSLLPSKLTSRVFVYDTVESVSKVLPASCLPKDYGGYLKSLDEMREDSDVMYQENRESIMKYINTKSREELRQGEFCTDDMKGTFMKLSID